MDTLRSRKDESDRVCLIQRESRSAKDIPIYVYPTCRSPPHQSCHNHPGIRPQARWIISNALHPFYFPTYHLLFKSPPSLQLPFNLSSHLLHRTRTALRLPLNYFTFEYLFVCFCKNTAGQYAKDSPEAAPQLVNHCNSQ